METTTIQKRLAQIAPDSQRLWGSMSANQMLTHCADQIRICLGDVPCRMRGNALTRTISRWIALYVPMRMPKNLKTIAELDPNKQYMTQPKEFKRDFHELEALYSRMLILPESHQFQHPVFGKLTKKEAIRLTDIHLDHHLRQFGI